MKNEDTISALVGGAFFAIPYLALAVPILPSLAIGAGAFVAGELVFKKSKTPFMYRNIPVNKILDNAKKQSKHIASMIPSIDDQEIKNNLREISGSINRIISTIEKDPRKIKNLSNFFDYYLPVTVKIIDRYNEIEDQNLSSKDSKKFIVSTNNMVKEINSAFHKILNSLYEKDIIDTDVEMKVFNSMLKNDGFNNDDFDISEEDKNG